MTSTNTTPTTSASIPIPTRKPFHGSCHCGLIRFVIFMTLPPPLIHASPTSTSTIRLRKCNCTTCHKMGLFHIRLPDAPNDFMLLNPTGMPHEKGGWEDQGMKSYRCFDQVSDWWFCGTCGVRPFVTGLDLKGGEMRKVDLRGVGLVEVGGEEVGVGEKEVWMCSREGKGEDGKMVEWVEGETGYLSVNATALEAGQDGCDLREWHEKGWISYLDCLDRKEENRLGRPWRGGMY
ncbi:hypothetical protein SBOR_6130 [Sclerotinia borealis F-4128]|uniref:CENP-V/GFA domain-containing protein n=1 Tax=Sclerotinia borealis (strain F-4128) TaxID=1432307 RepID=W9CC89_SCLBF|nr:hypothetical protein SBOR_6130 [Sclerotinia borealis F-4128]